jgi:hypothetical protein
LLSLASSLTFQYLSFPLTSSSSCLCFHPHVSTTSTLLSIFLSVMHFRRQFLHNMGPIQQAFLRFTVRMVFLSSLPLRNNCSFFARLVKEIFTYLLQQCIWKYSEGKSWRIKT